MLIYQGVKKAEFPGPRWNIALPNLIPMVSVKNFLLVSEGPGVPQELGPAVFYMNYPHRILIRWSVLGFAVCVVSFFFV